MHNKLYRAILQLRIGLQFDSVPKQRHRWDKVVIIEHKVQPPLRQQPALGQQGNIGVRPQGFTILTDVAEEVP
ncbi:hypothetical protein DF186_24885, partial [Enterococcus hirae]